MSDNTVAKYDRIRGMLEGVALFTKPSTIVPKVEEITGRSDTFIVETCRQEEVGDTIFVRCVDETGVVRMALPPRVADAIARQRQALTDRTRSRAAKSQAQARKERGEVPGFMRKAARA